MDLEKSEGPRGDGGRASLVPTSHWAAAKGAEAEGALALNEGAAHCGRSIFI